MFYRTLLSFAMLILAAACNVGDADTRGATSASGQVTMGQAVVSWREFNVVGGAPEGMTNVMVAFSGVNEQVDDPANPADGCFPAMRNFDACRVSRRELRLTKAESIQLAEQAFLAHPACAWGGYDGRYDMLARGRGLAAANDTRVLFAQVRC